MRSYSNISQLSLCLSFSYRSILMGCPRGSAFLLPSRVSDPRRFVPVPFFLFESDPNPKYWRQQEFLKKNSRYLVATAKCGVYLLSRMRLFDMTWLAGGNHLMVWDNAPPPRCARAGSVMVGGGGGGTIQYWSAWQQTVKMPHTSSSATFSIRYVVKMVCTLR